MGRKTTTLQVETLEDRCAPATWGNPWPDATHLTLSFVPDGTRVGNQMSDLFQTMDALAPTKVWQTAILKGFQSWAAQANISVSMDSDNGLPLGTAGSIQGDARFGDIRIAAHAMAAGSVAESTPFELDAGTWSGDVSINSAASFSVNGGSGTYDLFSVAIHEAGHAFGFDGNDDPTSVMYRNYAGVRTGLGSGDITAVQALYGPRTDADAGNDSLQKAKHLNPHANGNSSLSIAAANGLASLQDSVFYSFDSQLNYGSVDVTLRTAGISLMTPRVTIFGPNGKAVVTATATDPQAGGFVIHLTNAAPFNNYTIEVEGGQSNVFGIGDYQLSIEELPLANNLLSKLTATVTQGVTTVGALLDPLHTNTSFTTATPLTPYHAPSNATYYNQTRGTLNNTSDVAYYFVQAPATSSASGSKVLSAMVWGLQNQINPRVRVFDAGQNMLPAQIIVNDGYMESVQVTNATPGATYYVEVVQGPNGHNAGNYFVGVAFSPNALVMDHQTARSLTGAQPTVLQTLDTSAPNRSMLFHFVLSANASVTATVSMTLTDANGHVVFALSAGKAEAVTGNVILSPGVYYATFASLSINGTIPTVSFLLLGDILTAPDGPQPTDPSSDPGGSSTGGGTPPPTWSTGSTPGVGSTPPPSNPFTSGPVVTLQNPTDQTTLAGTAVQLALSASDSAGYGLTYTATGLPPGLSLNPNTGVISGTIANNAASTTPYVVMVTATDTANSSATQSFYWTVDPPIIFANDPGDQVNACGDNVSLAISASCTDGAPLTFSAVGLPPGLTIDAATGLISGVIADIAGETSFSVVIDIFDASSGVDLKLTICWTIC